MARIENRSQFKVVVQNRDDLTRTFAFTAREAVKAYVAELKGKQYKPKVTRLDDSFLVRFRTMGCPDMNLKATLTVMLEREQLRSYL